MDLSEHGTPWLFPPFYAILSAPYAAISIFSISQGRQSAAPCYVARKLVLEARLRVSALYIKLGWRLGLRDLARLACIGSSFPPRFVRDDERTCMFTRDKTRLRMQRVAV